MTHPLAALGRALTSQMAPHLLDAPLDTVELPGVTGLASELLRDSFEAGVARSLRELLREECIVRWAEESCTEREQEALATAFSLLLGGSLVGPDDPARLVHVEAPPTSRHALLGWAERHGLAAELGCPASDVLPADLGSPGQSLLDCTLQADELTLRGKSLLDGQRARDAAREYLLSAARSQAALPAREALWRSPRQNERLRVLAERLSALLVGTTPAALHTLCFVPARPVALDANTGVVTGKLRGTDNSSAVAVSLYLLGFEQRAVEGVCGACRRTPCIHLQALAGRLLDACLWPEDSLHKALEDFVAVPSWKRLFSALDVRHQGVQATAERLCFTLRVTGETGSVGVLVQRANSQGGYTAGKLVAPQRALTFCGDDDRSALDALVTRSRTLTAGYLPLDLSVLRALAEHPRVFIDGEQTPLRVAEQSLEVKLLTQPDGLLPEVRLDDKKVSVGARARGANYLMHHDVDLHTLRFAALTPALSRLLAALEHYRGVLPRESYPTLAPYLSSLQKVARVDMPKALLGLAQPAPKRLVLCITPLPDEGLDLMLCVRPFVMSGLWSPGLGPELLHGLEDGQPTHARRDLAWETATAEQVISTLRLNEALYVEPFRYRVESTQDALALLARCARVSELIAIEWAEQKRSLRVQGTVTRGDLKVGLFKRGAFFFAEGSASTAGSQVALGKLLEAARRNERFVRIEGNDYLEIEANLFERLQDAQLCVQMNMKDLARELRLPRSASRFWLDTLGDVTLGGDVESTQLLEAASLEPLHAPPSEPNVALRGYQRDGLAFLRQRATWAQGACLADEMGLGKTIQAIALLAERAELGAALVVAPTSVVDNWQRELQRFATSLTPIVYRGALREALLAQLARGHVLLTSYELLLRDRALFEDLHFATQVIDEAQVLKNARTLRARAVTSISSDFRVALSGTPVENRLGDLWSLFHLIAPGLLGSWPRFRARFAVPIERYDNHERKAALRRLIAPFMLRRTKNDVATELPTRSEVVHMVELSQAERDLYQSAVHVAKKAVGHRKRDDPARRVHILAELTRLRQLACHPGLVLSDARVESSKLNALLGLLDDILPRGHRVLVFSQFTAHLRLIREALDARNITSFTLEGSTPAGERSRLVDAFQAGSAPVFLISLKAGGTGLNLTAADYVVHMDPWWNPSAEDQASDRAHRIGQGRPVTIVKLVAEDTIEERVLLLHRHKRELADAIFREGPAAQAPELNELFDELSADDA